MEAIVLRFRISSSGINTVLTRLLVINAVNQGCGVSVKKPTIPLLDWITRSSQYNAKLVSKICSAMAISAMSCSSACQLRTDHSLTERGSSKPVSTKLIDRLE